MNIQQAYLQETGNIIYMNHCTLNNFTKDGQLMSDFNADKRWLSHGEENILVSYIVDNAWQGFPLSLQCLKEHADKLIWAKYGPDGDFPAEEVGQNWCSHFIKRYSNQIHAFHGHGIDAVQTGSVNEATNKAWYNLLEEVLQTGDKGGPVAPECIYDADGTPIPPAVIFKGKAYQIKWNQDTTINAK